MNRKRLMLSVVFAAGLLVAQVGAQQAPASAPAGTTGLCNDGTYYSGASKKGACRGHKGVKEWYGASANNEKGGSTAAGTSQTTPAPTANQAPERSTPAATSNTNKAPAPGGGAGMVWVNTSTNVYHCQGSRYYGKTKAGTYMSESEARAKGARPDHGKPCQ
jgi:hypothetical protein